MHPIEHLRYVARARYYDPCEAATDAAYALVALSSDPSGLLVGCRLVLDYHPANTAMWWVCARAVTAFEPRRVLRDCLEELHDKSTTQDDRVYPWETSMEDLYRQFPDAVQLLGCSDGK